MKYILTIAHRGASGLAPENTLSAFRKAVEFKADMVEMDVHLSADGGLVVIHDDTVDRVAGNIVRIPGTGHAVKRMTVREIKDLDVGSWFSPEFSGEKIPLLREALDLLKGKCGINIEIKRGSEYYPGIEEKVLEEVRAMRMEKDVLISSFDLRALEIVRKQAPTAALGIIFNTDIWGYVVTAAQKLSAVSINPDKALVTPERVHSAHAAGLKIYPYTVDIEDDMRALSAMGVDGLITDRPDVLNAIASS